MASHFYPKEALSLQADHVGIVAKGLRAMKDRFFCFPTSI
jgi:hypothetical protein